MADIILANVQSGYNRSAINDNFILVKAALDGETIKSSDGNNVMAQNLDLNSNRILNLPDALANQEPATLKQVNELLSSTSDGFLGDASLITATGTSVARTLADWAEREVLSYDTIALAKADLSLEVGRRIKTYGYHVEGDAGAGEYVVVVGGTGTEDEGSYHDADNGTQLKLNDSRSIKFAQFGAKTDGSEDTSPILLKAIVHLHSLGGGELKLGEGLFDVSSMCDLTPLGGVENITISGSGPSTILRFADGYNGNQDRWLFDTTNNNKSMIIRYITFDGNEENMGDPEVTRDKIIKIYSDNFRMYGCRFHSEAGRGVVTYTGAGSHVYNNYFEMIGVRTGSGVYPSDSSSVHPGQAANPAYDVHIYDNTSKGDSSNDTRHTFIDAVVADNAVIHDNIGEGDNQGLLLTSSSTDVNRVIIDGNTFKCRDRAVNVYTTGNPTTGIMRSIKISNNICKGISGIRVNGFDNVSAGTFEDVEVLDNDCSTTDFGGASGTPSMITLSFIKRVRAANNKAQLGRAHGIFVSDAEDVILENNQAFDNSQDADDTFDGIRVDTNIDCILAKNNTCANRLGLANGQSVGLKVENSATLSDVRIFDNVLLDNRTAGFNDSLLNVTNARVKRNEGFNDVLVSTSLLDGSQSEYNGGRHSDVWRVTSTQTITLQGLNASGPYDGRRLTLMNVGAFTITLGNESSGASEESKRIRTGTGGNLSVGSGRSVNMVYDGTAERWIVISKS